MMHSESDLALRTRLEMPFDAAVARVTEALGAEGFGILTTIDMKATLLAKLGAPFRPYTILGACNPPLAHRALQADLDVGLLLPCNVVVYDDGGASEVAILDPGAMLGLVQRPELDAVAQEARARLERVVASLSTEGA